MTEKNRIILIKNISKSLGEKRLFEDANLQVKKGEIIILSGPNGSGKSTLVSMLAGLVEQDSGQIQLFSKDVKTHRKEIHARINVIAPYINFCNDLTAIEVLISISYLYGIKEKKQKIDNLLALVGLDGSEYLKKKVSNFSSGEKMRLIFARGFLNEPELLFLDEAFVNLDEKIRLALLRYIVKLNKNIKTTLFIVSHDIDKIRRIASKVFIIKDRKIFIL